MPSIIQEIPAQGRSPEGLKSKQPVSNPVFDPVTHLAYQPPEKIVLLKDIHLPDSQIAPVASSIPFPLLSPEAIKQHRKELFSKDVLENCLYATRPGSVQLRGMAPRYAPFIHAFWTSPQVLDIVSSIAGVDLVPVMNYEICHTNVQLGPGGIEALKDTPIWPPEASQEQKDIFNNRTTEKEPREISQPIVPWHRDSHPFVCVVMLSNAEYMLDGETGLMSGDGTITKVRSPQCGHAVVLQGRSVSHIAIPGGNMEERITIVCSFRPRDPRLFDSSTNMNIRNKSLVPELNYQWTTYRLKLLSERFAILSDDLKKSYKQTCEDTDLDGKLGACKTETINVEELSVWMKTQMKYMEQTLHEMRPLTAEDAVISNVGDEVV